MSKRIFTKGDVEIQEIKVGDIHYEYGYGLCIKSIVKTLPKESEKQKGFWEWESRVLNENNDPTGEIINYGQAEEAAGYGINLYKAESYFGCKQIT